MSGGKLLVAVTFVLVLSASVLATLHFVRGERGRERAERRAEVMAVLKGSHSRASATAERLQEALNENGREGNRGEETGGPQLEQYLNRALPRSTIAFAQVQTASNAARKIKQNGRLKFKRGWQELGPFTLDIARLATQTFNAPTQWSGRVTALAIEPGCTASACRLYVGAAGGGVWRADDALARTPHWTPINAGIPTNSIGSLLIDPNDPSGRTIYVGTGEESGSSDSEAGLGLYKSIDGGGHWSLVSGSLAVSKDRGIGAVAVDPRNPQHIFIGTDVARHGASNVNGGRFTPPGAPLIGLYESKDGGATFTPRVIKDQDAVDPNSPNGSDFFRGGVTKIAYDPAHPS
ncbi:MAG: hypothetical protein E6G67_05005, partial [Actinobacteria bacterium]